MKVVLIAGALALLAVAFWSGRTDREARAKLKTLEDILRSKNDNDPRLDSDFASLSPAAKRLLRQRYGESAPERRNERGTIVYLLGRSASSREDWEFLRAVASEPPCLSLADCSKKAPQAEGALGQEVTLAYPSLVALKQAERALPAEGARLVIEAAKRSKTPIVRRTAARVGAAAAGSVERAPAGPR